MRICYDINEFQTHHIHAILSFTQDIFKDNSKSAKNGCVILKWLFFTESHFEFFQQFYLRLVFLGVWKILISENKNKIVPI